LAVYGEVHRWRHLADPGAQLSRVDGLAYDAYRRALLAVGPSTDETTLRVVAIDPTSGATSVLFEWSRSPATTDRYEVAVGDHQTVYLGVVGPTAYRVLRIARDGSVRGVDPNQGQGVIPGVLAAGTLVGRTDGVFFTVEEGTDQAFRAYESKDMRPLSNPSAWLGGTP
jgi:hypothetical protein